MITAAILLCTLSSLSSPALAAGRCSMERRERETDQPYTFGDIAAARLAVYGLMDPRFRTPQPETAETLSGTDAVELLLRTFPQDPSTNGKSEGSGEGKKPGVILYRLARSDGNPDGEIPAASDDTGEHKNKRDLYSMTQGLTEVPSPHSPVSEADFVTVLLNAMGYTGQFDYIYPLEFADSIGLAPSGLSRRFTLGDAALYLQCALNLRMADGTLVRDTVPIPEKREQAVFPAVMVLTPLCAADAESQIRLATEYLAETILIRGDYLSKEDLSAIYLRYYSDSGELWYLSRVDRESGLCPELDTIRPIRLPEDLRTAYASAVQSVRRQYDAGELTIEQYWVSCAAEKARYLCSGKSVTLYASYNEAWELACDLDDAFTLYVDDRLTQRADSFYQRSMADAETDTEKVYAAKNAIIARAEYASAVSYDAGEACYAREAHSILGFFHNGRVVCEGYASVFQYLMIRAGLDCVMVYGSTESRTAAEAGHTDHVWNKVRVDGVWYNMDVCWSDTGWPYTFDLKSNEYYTGRRHWAVTYRYL